MEFDDIIYLVLLIFTIVFGYFFRHIKDAKKKKWTSTVVGFLIVLFVSGIHVLHSVIFTFINAVLILYTSKRTCHINSFTFSFLYLMFFRTTIYFGINYPPLHTNLVQMIMTLKIVGLAFEVHDSYKDMTPDDNKELKCKGNTVIPKFLDIIHYAYCYIGVLTGPYYSYKTYTDYFKNDFYKYVNCEEKTKKKLIFVPFCAIIFILVSNAFPVKYAESDDFYVNTSFWYRLWYITPVFVSFRMRIYVGLLLSEAACIIAGLGAYPEYSEPKPGKGPSIDFDSVEKIEKDTTLKTKSNFNFETVHNINIWYTEFDPLVRSSIHHWNMCVQYWMVFVVYKRFPYKALRTPVTFTVSAIWHGVYAGYYLCLCPVPFYFFIEDIWNELLRKGTTGRRRIVLDVLFWIVRTQAFSYMGMAFSLLSLKNGLRYYASVYYIYHVTSFIGLLLGLVLKSFNKKESLKQKKSKNK